MRNYLILRAKSRAFRADPEVQQALLDARVDQLAQATLAPGESLDTLRAEAFDPEQAAAAGGFGLLSMRARAAAIGAELTLSSALGQGTTLVVALPRSTGESYER